MPVGGSAAGRRRDGQHHRKSRDLGTIRWSRGCRGCGAASRLPPCLAWSGDVRTLPQYDPETVGTILTYAERVGATVANLSKLRERVFLHQESGFAGLIDLDRSQ